ncbi:MAG TPA: helix-turn-helix domain-containing protein [Thermoanaerobaculia bacterium]|nr:helix-turn-helix domain-containing protein [Thermoanaerobaculia bacterium]
MPDRPSPHAPALAFLRTAIGWSQARLASALGLGKEDISKYERGDKALTRETLDFLTEPSAPSEAVDVILLAHGLIFPEAEEKDPSPVALTPEEIRSNHRALLAGTCAAVRVEAERLQSELSRGKRQEKIEAARKEAALLWDRLKASNRQDRWDAVAAFPEIWSWALAERVSHESERKAAHSAGEALELAELALEIAERAPGEESWRARLKGYCWAHLGNARRVANDLAGADTAFAQAWHFWGAGAASDPGLLAGWRLYDLDASLRRDQRRFPEALQLLEQARAGCGDDPLATGRILLKKEHVFDVMGDAESALAVLREAAPLVEASGDTRQLFALRFNIAADLVQLERYEEAAKLLPQVQQSATQQRNELDLIRVVWLRAKVAAGLGWTEEAIAGLEQVGQDFTARELPYDAALSWLDLAVLLLKAGRTAEVRELAVRMVRIFKNQEDFAREALAALQLFCEAAFREAATVELARRVITDIERARRSAPPLVQERGRG